MYGIATVWLIFLMSFNTSGSDLKEMLILCNLTRNSYMVFNYIPFIAHRLPAKYHMVCDRHDLH